MTDGASSKAGGGEIVPHGDLRAAHGDRDRVVEVLTAAAGDGRLTAAELDDRVGAALTARTFGELEALLADLLTAPESWAGGPAVQPKDLVRIVCHAGTARRDGPWMVPRHIDLRVTSGTVTLDFTEAVISWPSLQIDAEVHGGSLTLLTKPGILVSTDDLENHGSSVEVRAPWGPDVPVMLRIDVSGKASGSSVKAHPPWRTLWQRLRRRPIRPR